jgi:hypothetical protein
MSGHTVDGACLPYLSNVVDLERGLALWVEIAVALDLIELTDDNLQRCQ